jgi:hypothetical protein
LIRPVWDAFLSFPSEVGYGPRQLPGNRIKPTRRFQMLRKLAAPFLILSVAAFYGGACSSDSKGGTGGAGGKAGTGGAGGVATGTGGGAGGVVGGTGGRIDGGSSDLPAGEVASEVGGGEGGTLPACSVTTDVGNTDTLTPTDFCKNYLAACNGVTGYTVPTQYASQANCEAAYAATTTKHCESYHLCANAVGKTNDMKVVHCPHATGLGPCLPPDGGGGQ